MTDQSHASLAASRRRRQRRQLLRRPRRSEAASREEEPPGRLVAQTSVPCITKHNPVTLAYYQRIHIDIHVTRREQKLSLSPSSRSTDVHKAAAFPHNTPPTLSAPSAISLKQAKCRIVGLPCGQFQGCSIVPMCLTTVCICLLFKAIPIMTLFLQALDANIALALLQRTPMALAEPGVTSRSW